MLVDLYPGKVLVHHSRTTDNYGTKDVDIDTPELFPSIEPTQIYSTSNQL